MTISSPITATILVRSSETIASIKQRLKYESRRIVQHHSIGDGYSFEDHCVGWQGFLIFFEFKIVICFF